MKVASVMSFFKVWCLANLNLNICFVYIFICVSVNWTVVLKCIYIYAWVWSYLEMHIYLCVSVKLSCNAIWSVAAATSFTLAKYLSYISIFKWLFLVFELVVSSTLKLAMLFYFTVYAISWLVLTLTNNNYNNNNSMNNNMQL